MEIRPSENRERSPYTGWTRAHREQAADRMLTAVRPSATDAHARVHLPGPQSRSGRWSDGLEGVARTFLLAALRPAHGADGGHAEWYAAGLAAGSDPGSRERWPRPDELPQARVEAASIALGLHESGLWTSLDDGVRERLAAWPGGMRRAAAPVNNWVWFRAVVSACLRRAGALPRSRGRTASWTASSSARSASGRIASGGLPLDNAPVARLCVAARNGDWPRTSFRLSPRPSAAAADLNDPLLPCGSRAASAYRRMPPCGAARLMRSGTRRAGPPPDRSSGMRITALDVSLLGCSSIHRARGSSCASNLSSPRTDAVTHLPERTRP